MTVRVDSVFGYASLQDFGRPGFRKYGVPPGGAFDRGSLVAANLLLGNGPDCAAIEFALGTLEMTVLSDGVLTAVGAAASIEVDGNLHPTGSPIKVGAGAKFVVRPPVRGLRTYIAFPGGVDHRPVLGSASGIRVENGAHLQSCSDSANEPRTIGEPRSLEDRPLRVVSMYGGEWTQAEYTVGRNIDRVGLRLDGPKPMIDAKSGTSEPSVIGAVQLTEDRTLIIHGPDGPTIGGYKKIGCIVRDDLDRVGQLAPGDRVRFVETKL